MVKLFLNALDISVKAAIIILAVVYYFDRREIFARIKTVKDEMNGFKTETERQIGAVWKKIDSKLDTEIPSYFKEIKEMWHNNDKCISNQKIEFDNLNKKVDDLAKRQDTLISSTLETLAILVKRGKNDRN